VTRLSFAEQQSLNWRSDAFDRFVAGLSGFVPCRRCDALELGPVLVPAPVGGGVALCSKHLRSRK
jgi:hypothetical protein